MDEPTLPQLLETVQPHLIAVFRRNAGWLLRYESIDDLMQGLHLRLLERGGGFRYEGEAQFHKWINLVATTHLADRRTYWSALKRRAAGLLRLTASGTDDPRAVAEPAADATGPSTFAARREELTIGVRALAALPERDRKLVQWTVTGVPLDQMAERLELAYDAVKHARQRALERFRKAYRLAERSGRGATH